jgi:dipeptidyl aminopeptidase/acylaminoacyl peptidase
MQTLRGPIMKLLNPPGPLLALLLSLSCTPGLAQTAEPSSAPPVAAQEAARMAAPVPVENFFRHPDVLDAQLSPSGKLLALTSAVGAKRVSLVVLDLDTPGKVNRVAQFTDMDVVRFNWVNDKRLIFSVADLETGSGEGRYTAPGLFSVDAQGQELRRLVALRPGAFVNEGARFSREALPWNHVLLHVPQRQARADAAVDADEHTDDVIIGELVWSSARELSSVVPKWLNTRTGRTRFMDLQAPRSTQGWLFDSRGEARVAVSQDKGRRVVHWRGPGQTEWQQLSDDEALRPSFTPNHVDDAGNLYVTHRKGPEGLSVLSRYDFERRAPATEPWVTVEGFDFTGSVLTARLGEAASGVRVEADAETTVWFDDQMKRFQQQADERLPGGVNRVSCRRCGQPDMVALVRQFADRDPGHLWLYSASTGQWRPVSPVLRGIQRQQMATVDLQRIKARDGRDLPVWLTLPQGRKAGSPGPAVVLVHGGPWVRGGHWRWSAMEQFLASRGYLVISPDFRGSRGYGQAHFEAGWKQWGQAMQDDVADAVLWAQAQGLADKRVCIAGASYGGYATLMGLVRHPELYRCGVAWVAVTDPFLVLEGSWWVRDDTSDSDRRYTLPQLVGDANKDADMLISVSPVAQAHKIRAPLLLGFGEADLRVPLAHGKRLREALQKVGRDPQWVTYPDEGHSWRLPQTRTDFARRMEIFLSEHLK